MKRSFTIISAALLFTVAASAQNLNPVVEVTNTYEGRLSDIHKPDQVMNIPDSVTHFKLDFDYSVFDNPYKGAYEFSPYLVTMTPEPAPSDLTRLYLRAGAGYTLRPELGVIWNPNLKKGFSANVHADLNSFVGDYRNIGPERGEDAILMKYNGTKTAGYYVRGGAGADLGYAWRRGEAALSLDYLKQADNYPVRRNYDGFVFHPSVRSTDPDASLYYAASFKYRLGKDRFEDDALPFRWTGSSAPTSLEHYAAVDATVGPVLDASSKILVDLSLVTDQVSALSKSAAAAAGNFEIGSFSGGHVSLVPRYIHTGDRLDWTAGLRLAFLFGGDGEYFSHRGQKIFPEATVSYRILEESLTAYAAATGGPRLHTYGSMLENNRYFSMAQMGGHYVPFDHSIEQINVKAGLKGNVRKRLQWDISGGYAVWDHALSDGFDPELLSGNYYVYSDMKVAFADFRFLFDSQPVDVDGILSLRRATGLVDGAFAPALLSGDIKAAYDWKGRIRAGLRGEFSTTRKGHYSLSQTGGTTVIQAVRVPGYVDLGLFGEYVFSRKWSLWAKAGNLLNQTIQRTPFYAENGVYFTAGICLNIR